MRRLAFRTLRSGLACAALCAPLAACGDLSDPTKPGEERVAVISGALTGAAAPEGARVALVWMTNTAVPVGYSLAVGGESPIVDGAFSIPLDTPPSYYAPWDVKPTEPGGSESGGDPSDPVPPTEVLPPSMLPTAFRPLDTRGSIVGTDLEAARGGFVVYLDTNGNGKLDIETDGSSPDEILGGNERLLLAHMRGGGSLDYEELRDSTGVAPAPGYNLRLLHTRWLPLDRVELKLGDKQLPGWMCGHTQAIEEPDPTVDGPDPLPGEPESPYPSPDDPNLTCGAGGYSFTYEVPCPPRATPKPSLCTPDRGWTTDACAPVIHREDLPDGAEPPEGWPCPITGD